MVSAVETDIETLRALSRRELIDRAGGLGLRGAELLTRDEIVDELLRRSALDRERKRRLRGWFGVARDLLASLVEQQLHLPEAAERIRARAAESAQPPAPRPPVPTVTLAGIYAEQGHGELAREILDEVLRKEPDHESAKAARRRLSDVPVASRAGLARVGGGEGDEDVEPREDVEADAELGPRADGQGDAAMARAASELHEERLPLRVPTQGEAAAQGAVSAPAAGPTRSASGAAAPARPVAPSLVAERDGGRWRLHWRAPSARPEDARSDAVLALGIRIFQMEWDGVRSSAWHSEVAGESGTVELEAGAGAELSAALGWLTPLGGFLPLALAARASRPA